VENGNGGRTKMVVGLGNPGRKYRRTRHNVGFMVVDVLVGRWHFGAGRKAFGGLFYDGRVSAGGPEGGARRVLLLLPHTYMNCSGQAVKGVVEYYGIACEDLLIVMDDMALPVGRIRVRSGGSAGGHKGLIDVQEKLGTSDLPRLRVGIGSPPEYMDAMDHVLRAFEDDEAEIIEQAVTRAADAVEEWLFKPLSSVMDTYNARQD